MTHHYQVCSVPIAAVTPSAATGTIVQAAKEGRSLQVHLCNAYTLSLVDSDAELRAALETSDLNLPDGTPVAWLGRRSGVQRPVRGPGLVEDVVNAGGSLPHYLYGAGPGVAQKMADNLRQVYANARFVGIECPPFGGISDEEVKQLAERVRDSKAKVLWVGLGTPSQDYFVPRIAAHLSIPVVPVGAAFDFFAGNTRQAPSWMRGSGLEWLHRLAHEPRRLWRRYLLGNPRFLWTVLKHRGASRDVEGRS